VEKEIVRILGSGKEGESLFLGQELRNRYGKTVTINKLGLIKL
jgi:hypothetical protein